MVTYHFMEKTTVNNWLSGLDRLLGGDGNTFSKGAEEQKSKGESSAPPHSNVSAPLHTGARDLVDHLATAAMKI